MRSVRALCSVLVAGALLAGAPLAHAQWKWRDANGRLNVSDTPPPVSVPDKDILQRPSAPAPEAAPAGSAPASARNPAAAAAPPVTDAAAAPGPRPAQADPQLEARRRAAEQERQAREKAEQERAAAVRAQNCKRARGNLAALESGQRIARANEKGEREVLDDKARAEEIRLARAVIASDCREGT